MLHGWSGQWWPANGTLEPLICVLKINIFANNFPVYFSPSRVHYLHLSMSFNACTISSSKITLHFQQTNIVCHLQPQYFADCLPSHRPGTAILKLHSDDLQVYNTLESHYEVICKVGEGQGSSGG